MQVTEQPPIAAGEFERVLDVRLIMSVVAAGIMSFADVVVEAAMNVTFPALMDEFGVNTATVQWMTTAYLLVLAVIMPPVVSQPTLRHPLHLHGGQSSLHLGHRMRLLRRLVPHAARWTRARGCADPLVPALFVAFALMLAAQVGASDMAAATVAGTREAYVLLAFVAAAGLSCAAIMVMRFYRRSNEVRP